MPQTPETLPWSHILRIADLRGKNPMPFTLAPEAAICAAISVDLGLSGVRKLRFQGTLSPSGRRDWQLSGVIGVTVTQPCIVTLEPVVTRIDETLQRSYLVEMPDLDVGSETEMPDDDTIEPLPEILDLGAVMVEALVLHLPQYPRIKGAQLSEAVFSEPGIAPMKDEDARPFAGLQSLRDKLAKDSD